MLNESAPLQVQPAANSVPPSGGAPTMTTAVILYHLQFKCIWKKIIHLNASVSHQMS